MAIRRGAAAVIKSLIDRIFRKKSGHKQINISGRKRLDVARRLERYAEAAALAQAGLQDVAQEIIRHEIQERPKILVVGSKDGFSRPLIDYAVGLAKRMKYEIVALNCAGIATEASEKHSPYREKLLKEFKARAAEAVEPLASCAAQEGVPIRHVVKSGGLSSCLRELQKEVSRLNFVLTESVPTQELELETSIPVFCINK
ncbi:MAG: universal stress protein [Deltaproteobacteria bacterium]|nr:MAG: universal stress protein [Deltaproteobacteria bacterium]